MPRRLQLGTSRLENLDPKVLKIFKNSSWIHLGDPEAEIKPPLQKLFNRFREKDIKDILKYFSLRISYFLKSKEAKLEPKQIYKDTTFMAYYYEKGNYLPIRNETIDFVFSEHFFEHLFFDEALSLYNECYRVLKPWGIIRTVVPDADLRTYEAPEPVGYPSRKMPFTHPLKHKTRWSVYSLSETLRTSGFKPVPLRYCDKFGQYWQLTASDMKEKYADCTDSEMIYDMSYISRNDSLIVDGIKG